VGQCNYRYCFKAIDRSKVVDRIWRLIAYSTIYRENNEINRTHNGWNNLSGAL